MSLPKLNLRDLFWLIVVVALAVGWWADRTRLARVADKWVHLAQLGESGFVMASLDEFFTAEGYDIRWNRRRIEIVGPKGNGVAVNPPRYERSRY